MKLKNKITSLFIIICSCCPFAGASMLDYITPAEPAGLYTDEILSPQKAKLTQNDIHNHYAIAMQRFMECNVKSAYMDFKILIESVVPNDYVYLKLADEMAEIGLFNLSEAALNKISDNEIVFERAEDIKNFYYPQNMLKPKDEIYLAEIYSNIIYNAQSREAAAELIKNTRLLEKSDYANYLAALGMLKCGDLKNAGKYIASALKINPQNLNYQKLKIEIILQGSAPQNALKLLADLKVNKLYTQEFVDKVNALSQYTFYKTAKNDTLKKYHLGYYYLYKQEYTKAARTLQGAVTAKKSTNRDVYALLAEVYFAQKEYEKAENFADKSLKLDRNNKQASMVMGKIKFRNKEYKEALKYFKGAELKNDMLPSAWLAKTYAIIGNSQKAKQINTKILKDHSDCFLVYYNVALEDKQRGFEYMKKAVSLKPEFMEGWLGLVKISLDRNKFEDANKYLAIVKYIDENDFRYYYYQGLIYKAKGLNQDARYCFQKSHTINPDNELVKKELGI